MLYFSHRKTEICCVYICVLWGYKRFEEAEVFVPLPVLNFKAASHLLITSSVATNLY